MYHSKHSTNSTYLVIKIRHDLIINPSDNKKVPPRGVALIKNECSIVSLC